MNLEDTKKRERVRSQIISVQKEREESEDESERAVRKELEKALKKQKAKERERNRKVPVINVKEDIKSNLDELKFMMRIRNGDLEEQMKKIKTELEENNANSPIKRSKSPTFASPPSVSYPVPLYTTVPKPTYSYAPYPVLFPECFPPGYTIRPETYQQVPTLLTGGRIVNPFQPMNG